MLPAAAVQSVTARLYQRVFKICQRPANFISVSRVTVKTALHKTALGEGLLYR
jgi:hypothetical protein